MTPSQLISAITLLFSLQFSAQQEQTLIKYDEFDRTREAFVSIQPMIYSVDDYYRLNGYQSVQNWLGFATMNEHQLVGLLSLREEQSMFFCNRRIIQMFNGMQIANQYIGAFTLPSSVNFLLKTDVLFAVGQKVYFGNDQNSPEVQHMLNNVENIIKREAVVGSNFRQMDRTLELLYKELFNSLHRRPIYLIPPTFLQLEDLQNRYRKLNFGGKVSGKYQETFQKCDQIFTKMRKFEAIDQPPKIKAFVGMVKEYFKHLMDMQSILNELDYDCTMAECMSRSEYTNRTTGHNWSNNYTCL